MKKKQNNDIDPGDAERVIHHPQARRFELPDADPARTAFISYTREGGTVCIDRTFVPEHLRGRGIAGRLTRAALAEARKQGWKVVPRCSYVADFITRNPEYTDLLSPHPPP